MTGAVPAGLSGIASAFSRGAGEPAGSTVGGAGATGVAGRADCAGGEPAGSAVLGAVDTGVAGAAAGRAVGAGCTGVSPSAWPGSISAVGANLTGAPPAVADGPTEDGAAFAT